MKIVCIGDAMIAGTAFQQAAREVLSAEFVEGDWETDWPLLQKRRLIVEQQGPGVEDVPELLRLHPDAQMAVGLFCPFSADYMDLAPDLRLIGVARAGVENVDVKAATDRGIFVVNVMGRNAEAVSDYVIGLLLSEIRNIARAHAAIRQGDWRKRFPNSDGVPELRGKTVGIAGFGHIGRLVARKLSGFSVRILVYDPWVAADEMRALDVESVDKETLFSTSDFLTLHARLTDESRHLVNADTLRLMKPTAYLLNTARSGLVDMDALVAALAANRIAGAGLDVFEEEPIPAGHPLLALDNVTLTTHIAGTTREALTRSPALLMEQIAGLIRGESRVSLKNPAVLKRTEAREWLRRCADIVRDAPAATEMSGSRAL
jgi:D-3-phosphoglycerate dehydrogenase